MAEYIDISYPVIEETRWIPNPADAGKTVIFAAKIIEKGERLYPLPFAAGEIAAGET